MIAKFAQALKSSTTVTAARSTQAQKVQPLTLTNAQLNTVSGGSGAGNVLSPKKR
jgi:hypothetical protein